MRHSVGNDTWHLAGEGGGGGGGGHVIPFSTSQDTKCEQALSTNKSVKGRNSGNLVILAVCGRILIPFFFESYWKKKSNEEKDNKIYPTEFQKNP